MANLTTSSDDHFQDQAFTPIDVSTPVPYINELTQADRTSLALFLHEVRSGAASLTKGQILGMMTGVVLGDALGLPYETMTPGAMEGISLNQFELPASYNRYLQEKGHKNLPRGRTSDDWQLTKGVAMAVVGRDHFVPQLAIEDHLAEQLRSDAGWGGSVLNGLAQFRMTGKWNVAPVLPDEKSGLGNGVIIKLSPVAAYVNLSSFDVDAFLKLVASLTITTHPTNISAVATLVGLGVTSMFLNGNHCKVTAEKIFRTAISLAEIGERAFDFKPSTDGLLSGLLKQIERHTAGGKNFDAVTLIEYVVRLQSAGVGKDSYAHRSLALTLSIVARGIGLRQTPFETLQDVIRCGGDTDSNAAMAGALLGALHGPDVFPRHLVDQIDRIAEVRVAASTLSERLRIT